MNTGEMDKEGQITQLLIKRLQKELTSREYSNAYLIAESVSWIDPDNEEARSQVREIFLDQARKLIRGDDFEGARELLLNATKSFPEDRQLEVLLTMTKEGKDSYLKNLFASFKGIASDIIKKYYPQESSLFERSWAIFQDVLQGKKDLNLAGALAAAKGDATVRPATPTIILTLYQICKDANIPLQSESKKAIINAIQQHGRKMNVSDEVTSNIINWINESDISVF